MALQKQKELESGVVASYWKVTAVVLNKRNPEANQVMVELALYKDAEARQAEKAPITAASAVLGSVEQLEGTIGADTFQKAYTILKTKVEFDQAQDC